MRSVLLGLCTAFALSAAPVLAATVTSEITINHGTTDWTPFVMPDPDMPEKSLLVGSEIFEGYNTETRVPELPADITPDWIHVAHDLTLTVLGRGLAGSAGDFAITLPFGILVAEAGYDRTENTATSGRVHSVGSIAIAPAHFDIFQSNTQFYFEGGARSFFSVAPDYFSTNGFAGIERTHVDARLTGSLTVTAGYGTASEPALRAAVVTVSAVPLPSSGLLLGGVLLLGAHLRRKPRKAFHTAP